MTIKPYIMILFLVILIAAGVVIAQNTKVEQIPIPETHVYHRTDSTITPRPTCTECHTDEQGAALKPIAIFNHSSGFIRDHRFYASQNDLMCKACHRPSFCADCHANKAELKPSFKHFDAPERAMPHRGNYLVQHRIDGRIDPTPCFRCHGRQNNAMCRQCHRQGKR
jgi:hypothetical protein